MSSARLERVSTRRAVVAVILLREHLPFIRHWCEHHLSQGWKVFLYNNQGSGGSLRKSSVFSSGKFQRRLVDKRGNAYGNYSEHLDDEEVLEAFNRELAGLDVTLVEWQPRDSNGRIVHGQVEAYVDFIRRNRHQIDWAAFIDADEYLYRAPGLDWDQMLAGITRQNCHRLVLGGVFYENRWTKEGTPRPLAELRCCGSQKGGDKNIVRLSEVLYADIHFNWKMDLGNASARADVHQFRFDHYRQKGHSVQTRILKYSTGMSWDESLPVDPALPEISERGPDTDPEGVNIAIFSTPADFPRLATMLASVLRRTGSAVRVKCWCSGFLPEDFTAGRLNVEFIAAHDPVDRMNVISEAPDWRRCLFLEPAMLVFGDVARWLGEDLGESLLGGRLCDSDYTLERRQASVGGIPDSHLHCAGYQWFHRGYVLDLDGARQAGFDRRWLAARSALGTGDERAALCAALGNRVKNSSSEWNVIPTSADPQNTRVHGGSIHWALSPMPWEAGAGSWSRDLWQSECSSWEHLRQALWEKPVSLEISPTGDSAIGALFRRGWKVVVGGTLPYDPSGNVFPELPEAPDLAIARRAMRSVPVEQVRFGAEASPAGWIRDAYLLPINGDALGAAPPPYVVLSKPVTEAALRELWDLGYQESSEIAEREWPAGGPAPRALSYRGGAVLPRIKPGHHLYLKLTGEPPPATAKGREEVWDHDIRGEWGETNSGIARFIREKLPALTPAAPFVLELGPGCNTGVFSEAVPAARVRSLESDEARVESMQLVFCENSLIRVVHAPLDPVFGSYPSGDIEPGSVDILLINGPEGAEDCLAIQSALFLIPLLRSEAVVILNHTDRPALRDWARRWERRGFRVIDSGKCHSVLQLTGENVSPDATGTSLKSLIGKLAERTYLIQTPASADAVGVATGLTERCGMTFEIIPPVPVESSGIRWSHIKNMGGKGGAEKLRGEHVIRAMSERLSVAKALREFLLGGAGTALVCLDTFHWDPVLTQRLAGAIEVLPDDWGLLYLAAAPPLTHVPVAPFLTRIQGSGIAPAVIWKRESAMRLLPQLETCDCEWEAFLSRANSWLKTYLVYPPASALP